MHSKYSTVARSTRVIKSLNEDSFKKMDKDLIAVHQLADLCRFSFVTILQIFDTKFQFGGRQLRT
jgi:hypothetical protein